MTDFQNSTWPEKYSAERITAEFDFGPDMAPGDSIASVEMVVTVARGADPSPVAVLVGVAQIKGKRVFQQLGNGLPGCSYRIECRATTAYNNLLVLRRTLPVMPI